MINIFDKILIVTLIIFAISFNFIVKNLTNSNINISNDVAFNNEDSNNDSITNNTYNNNNNVIVSINNEIYSTYELFKDDTYTINVNNSFNTFEVKDGYVKMINANCNDKRCLAQRKINSNFETIVCLPHKLVIEVDNNVENEIDSIAQ